MVARELEPFQIIFALLKFIPATHTWAETRKVDRHCGFDAVNAVKSRPILMTVSILYYNLV